MDQALTDITLVLDRSGSMGTVRDATISAVNEYINSQKTGPGRAVMTLVQFDDRYEPNYEAKPIHEVPALNSDTYVPRGMTALLDAIGRTVNATGKRLSDMPEEQRPGTVLFVIQTDGQENHSREYSNSRINEMIAHQREKYGWEFVFLGANQDAIATAAQYGIPVTAAMSYNASDEGTKHAFASVARSTEQLRTARASGDLKARYVVAEEDREKAMS